jgi:hypothetical protein
VKATDYVSELVEQVLEQEKGNGKNSRSLLSLNFIYGSRNPQVKFSLKRGKRAPLNFLASKLIMTLKMM